MTSLPDSKSRAVATIPSFDRPSSGASSFTSKNGAPTLQLETVQPLKAASVAAAPVSATPTRLLAGAAQTVRAPDPLPATSTATATDVAGVVTNHLTALTGSILNPFAATPDSPMPTDPPTAWTLLAAARRELFDVPAPTAPATSSTPSLVTSLLSPIVTAFFGVFDPVFAAVAGPPVLPPGSTVTVKSSTLQFDNGYVAPADWYFPADANPKGLIYLQHGFLALGPIYSYTAAALAEQTHSIVVAPTLTSNFLAADGNWLGGTTLPAAAADLFLGDRPALEASAWAAAGHPVALPQKVVLVGHSLGGNFVLSTAGDMVDNHTIGDLAGVVLLDGVAFQPDLVATTLDKVPSDLPIFDISSQPYMWNLYGQMETDLTALRPGQFNGVELVGGLHIDALQGGNPLIQFAEYLVAGFSQPQNVEAVKILATGWINDMLTPSHTGVYAPPGQLISIPTNAGIATAFSIPAPPTPQTPNNLALQELLRSATSLLFTTTSPPAATALPSSSPTLVAF